MFVRFLLAACSLVALAGSAVAQTTVGPLPSDAGGARFGGPLQQNFNAATRPAKDTTDADRRCREIAATYLNASTNPQLQNPTPGSAQAAQADIERQNAKQVYQGSGCE